jgi:hypothetical protein
LTLKDARRALRLTLTAHRACCDAIEIARHNNGDETMLTLMRISTLELKAAIRRLLDIVPNSTLTMLNDDERRTICGVALQPIPRPPNPLAGLVPATPAATLFLDRKSIAAGERMYEPDSPYTPLGLAEDDEKEYAPEHWAKRELAELEKVK